MKFKCFVIFAALIFVVSCGGSSNGNNQNENTDTGDTVTDGDVDSGDSGSADTDPSDSGHENPDTAPEQPDSGDSQPDGGDTAPDSGDSTPDEGDSAPDNGDLEPDEDADSTPGLPDQDPAPVIEMEEGIYLGIIGFNDDLTKKPIKRLTDANKSEFKSFINSLTQLNLTALYWADYSALEMMDSFTISPDLQLKKVALVTFTDGLDNQSLSSDDFNPGPYDTHAEYLDAIHSMIMDEAGIHGVPVTAYSIGLKGSDVTDEAKFENTLEKLATEETGDEKFVFQVTDMNEVGQHFADIAGSLYSVSTTINVGVYIPGGYDNGQVIRYTFDNVSAATNSHPHIDATYHRSGTSRTLENIQYEGFIPGASTISSSATGPHNELYFQFNDLKYSNGDPVSQSEIISKSRLWKQTSSGAWDGETEMNMAELPPIIDEDKSSALIMLVLDSTTSLGSDFSRMQNEARNFVEILVNGGSGVTESSPCDDNPCVALANSTHICTVNGSTYTCGCNSGYNWNGWQCASTTTPCNPNPCTSISNSTGVCTVSGTGYICGCQSGYTWNGGSCQSNGGSSLPECSSSTTSFPCRDSDTGYIWSEKAPSTKTWENAKSHCTSLNTSNYGGFSSGWHLPTIDELRTLLIASRVSANCQVSETNNCLSFSSCWSCSTCTQTGTQSSSGTDCASESDWGTSYSDGRYSKFVEAGYFWSSSTLSDYTYAAWGVSFSYGVVDNGSKDFDYDVRCVRDSDDTGDTVPGDTGDSGDTGDTAPEETLSIGNICTGQTSCYDNEEEITCPSLSSADFFGQDAQYTNKCTAQSFSSSSNVVIDNNTGLTWEKSPSSSEYTWENRATHCNDLNSSNYGGRNNWRVPNPLELLTIVNNSTCNPAMNSNFTGMPTSDSTYLWTNNEYKGNTSYAYYFSPSYGWYSNTTKNGTYKVLCVSGEEMKPAVSSDFTTSSDGTIVTDNRTGLMWQKNYPSSTAYTWVNALKYCEDLSYAGYTDWRLPNKNELASLVNYEKSDKPYSYFPDMPSSWFWSSSTDVDNTNYAWGVRFNYGSVLYNSKTFNIYVRCVR